MNCDKNCERKGVNRNIGNMLGERTERIDGQCPVYNMADGRHFTDYRPRCELNNSLVNSTNGVLNNYEYRMYLQHNASKLMDSLRNENYYENVCVPCYDFDKDGTMLPELNKVKCNEFTCTVYGNDQNGLGLGRDYNVSSSHPMLKHEKNNTGVDTFVYQNIE
jgi:hypothetical protein